MKQAARASHERPFAMALFKGLQAGVVIPALSIAHKKFVVFDMAFQSLFVLIAGYLIYSARHIHALPGKRNAAPVNG